MIEFSAGRVMAYANAIVVELDPASANEIKRLILAYGERVEFKVKVSVVPAVQPPRNNWLSIDMNTDNDG